MTRVGWRVARDADLDLATREQALAYAADDGTFALYNDYQDGTALLVADPRYAGSEELLATWRQTAGPDRPHALAPVPAVEGYGVFNFPYGPISMGVPEAGKFDLRTYGERVLNLSPVGGFKSRRIVDSIVGQPVLDAALRIERMAGNLSASHVAAFLAAAESAEQIEVPTVELWIRGFAQELQRVYNHVHVLARVAEAASQNVGLAQTHALAEEVLRLQGTAFGHRWLFGALLPNGPARRLERADREELARALNHLTEEFEALWALFLESRTFLDRIQATCIVSRHDAVRWGAVGPTLRATGVGWDDRLRVPSPPYTDLFLQLPHENGGDALARVGVRAAEVRASFLLLEQMLERWPSSRTATEAPSPSFAPGRGIGRVEAPSGDLVYDLTVAGGRVARVGFRSPSQANWPAFASGMRDAVFTDFHFAFESFGFAFAETDG